MSVLSLVSWATSGLEVEIQGSIADNALLLQVFGKWMICKDSATASKVIAITDKISCVTIEGDVHARKGTITGGHRDKQK